ncbi:MAG TPA: hypothetical protein PKJ99_03215 [Thermoanaerobaculales bacterium]|nr:hypothetical protein [Thermoanaerobaculales bacterium]HQL29954.1 hypothetical protein [Thermoanaerobaculales bacterium]
MRHQPAHRLDVVFTIRKARQLGLEAPDDLPALLLVALDLQGVADYHGV